MGAGEFAKGWGRGIFLRAAAAWALAVLATSLAWAAVDQQQLAVDLTAPAFLVGGVTNQVVAQTVTAGLAGDLVAVRVPVWCASGALVAEVQSLFGAVPSGVVLASRTVSGEALAPPLSGAEFRTLSLPLGVSCSAGEGFAIVLRSAGSCEVAAGPMGDPYRGGRAFFRDRDSPPGAWAPLGSRDDLPFQTVVETGGDGGFPAAAEERATGYLMVRCFLNCLFR